MTASLLLTAPAHAITPDAPEAPQTQVVDDEVEQQEQPDAPAADDPQVDPPLEHGDEQADEGRPTDPGQRSGAPQAPGVASGSVPNAAASTPADRSISGTVTFPAGMTVAQKRGLRVYVNEPGERGTHYVYFASGQQPGDGEAKLTYEPGTGNSATWTVSGLKRAPHHIWVDLRTGSSYVSAPLYLGPPNAATGYDGPIDLTNGNFTAPSISLNVGSVSVTVTSQQGQPGLYRLELVNTRTGQATDVTRSVYSGSDGGNASHSNHDFNGVTGTYKLRVTHLASGASVYYDGTTKGTRFASQARTIQIRLAERVRLAAMDVRDLGTTSMFADVPRSHQFAQHIEWMAENGITTGVKQPNGTVKYLPASDINRGAMVAFLYRIESPSNYQPTGASPFADVQPGHKFNREIRWAYDRGIAAGVKGKDGKVRFMPGSPVNRGSMAAFMSRMYKNEIPASGTAVNFTDVPKSHTFYGPIRWMSQSGVGAGVKQPNGTFKYLPDSITTRGAMAASLYRAEHK